MSVFRTIIDFWASAGVFALVLLALSICSWFWLISLYLKIKGCTFRTAQFESEITDRIVEGQSLSIIKEWLYKQKGIVPRIIRYVLIGNTDDKKAVEVRYREASQAELLNIQKEFNLLDTLIKAMPLIGLLGTVAGMVDTFTGISGSGSQNMSEGISKALLTTQLGLLAALPGVFGIVYLRRQFDRFSIELNRLQFHINALRGAA